MVRPLTMQLHPIQRRFLAEDLIRRRRARETERYAASQRRGRIDLNPHQIDAVIFALERIPEGGCILADEVGLGKTIEAGLVMAQLLAEGMERILVIVPKPLIGQWQNELYTLFGIQARELAREDNRPGVLLIGREFAGSERGSALIREADPFGLVVIDEAHEIFAGIHKRYDRRGSYRSDGKQAIIAHRVRSALLSVPKLLLTATPIQNSLVELWGLIQYVEPTGTLLGDLATFRALFCAGDDRTLAPGQAGELRRRLDRVIKRTLRRQAREFLERPFVDRQAKLYEYAMSERERSLYDDVTRYLLDPDATAFSGSRQFLLIGFHRRMASSLPALAASLDKVAARLEAMLARTERARSTESTSEERPPAEETGQLALTLDSFADDPDFADELLDEVNRRTDSAGDEQLEATRDTAEETERLDPEALRAELNRVHGFIERARSVPGDSKAAALLDVVDERARRAETGQGSDKVVIFTESLVTQSYLRSKLLDHGLVDESITLFRGDNDSPRARQALARWQAELAIPDERRPSLSVAVRLALVHEFQTRSRVFIATEAGAKGLNLQFCETIVNYDLPWNPQRIEQRIGRCHRYSQTRDVTVVNFLAKDNEAERLLFDILSTKLDLFGTVFDASDAILHQARLTAPEPLVSALGPSIDLRVRRIYERARTVEEIHEQMSDLREQVARERQAFDDVMTHTYGLIESRFDERVKQVFRTIREETPRGLQALDRRIERLLSSYLGAVGIAHTRQQRADGVAWTIGADARLPESLRTGVTVALGTAQNGEESLHLGHPLIAAAVAESRAATECPLAVSFAIGKDDAELAGYIGRRGRLLVTKVGYRGYEPVEHLAVVAVLEAPGVRSNRGPDSEPSELLSGEQARALLDVPIRDRPPLDPAPAIAEDDLEDALEEAYLIDQMCIEEHEQQRFARMIDQIECFIGDRAQVLERHRHDICERLSSTEKRRDGALSSDRRSAAERDLVRLHSELEQLDADLSRLEARDDDDYQHWRARAHERRATTPARTTVLDVHFVLEQRGSS